MRYYNHRQICFYEKSKQYHSKIYQFIREKGITKQNFNEIVKIEILYQNIPRLYEGLMEHLIMNLYRDWRSSLMNVGERLAFNFLGFKYI